MRAIEALAGEVAAAGSSLLLAADSVAMAEHAAARRLIAAAALAEVRGERAAREGAAGPAPTREVVRPTAAETVVAVERGRVGEALGAEDDRKELPPNVLVEPRNGSGA